MWNYVQCASQGRGHIKDGTPCQDKTYALSQNGVSVISLADGAGSAKFSHYGAECVTEYICNDFCENFDIYFSDSDGVQVKRNILNNLLDELTGQTEFLKCELNDLASTLLVAAVKEDRFILLHIGDGVIGFLRNNELKIASYPENGEFANTTFFTTSQDALISMKLFKGQLNNISGFVLMSDGTEISLYDKREKKLADVLKRVIKLMSIVGEDKVHEYLQKSLDNVIRMATTDDCSIAIMSENSGNGIGYSNMSQIEKMSLFGIDLATSSAKKKLRRYENLILYLTQERSVSEIARFIHLRPKYVARHLDRLLRLNLVEQRGSKYKTIVIIT